MPSTWSSHPTCDEDVLTMCIVNTGEEARFRASLQEELFEKLLVASPHLKATLRQGTSTDGELDGCKGNDEEVSLDISKEVRHASSEDFGVAVFFDEGRLQHCVQLLEGEGYFCHEDRGHFPHFSRQMMRGTDRPGGCVGSIDLVLGLQSIRLQDA